MAKYMKFLENVLVVFFCSLLTVSIIWGSASIVWLLCKN